MECAICFRVPSDWGVRRKRPTGTADGMPLPGDKIEGRSSTSSPPTEHGSCRRQQRRMNERRTSPVKLPFQMSGVQVDRAARGSGSKGQVDEPAAPFSDCREPKAVGEVDNIFGPIFCPVDSSDRRRRPTSPPPCLPRSRRPARTICGVIRTMISFLTGLFRLMAKRPTPGNEPETALVA